MAPSESLDTRVTAVVGVVMPALAVGVTDGTDFGDWSLMVGFVTVEVVTLVVANLTCLVDEPVFRVTARDDGEFISGADWVKPGGGFVTPDRLA